MRFFSRISKLVFVAVCLAFGYWVYVELLKITEGWESNEFHIVISNTLHLGMAELLILIFFTGLICGAFVTYLSLLFNRMFFVK